MLNKFSILVLLLTIQLIPGLLSAQTCNSYVKLGFGDTTKPSDTRFSSQFCRRSTAKRNFTPGSGDRIFNNSLTPCEYIAGAMLYCGGTPIAIAGVRAGCPNGRLTFDFCGPNGGGARAIDARCRGKKLTVQVTKASGATFCYNPPCANCTFRNGRLVSRGY